MNIDLLRNAVIAGQISTLTAQKKVWEIYASRTNETVDEIINKIDEHVTELQKLVVDVPAVGPE